ncbi:MAG: amidohydrolase [Oscillospiraceae bacterium]|nr:amidohydrolase [Oscillospiraceae bacterium]
MAFGKIAFEAIEENRDRLWQLARRIWENPEGPNREYNACKWSAEMLSAAGFDVEIGVGGLATAIKASYGNGSPVIAFLGEYDALEGLSQKNVPWQEPVTEGGWGHGCGHNLLGVGHIGAVIGLAREMKAGGLPGTIIYYGCPAEEVLTGKVFMARAGAFEGVDMSIHWHPGSSNSVGTGGNIGLNNFKLHFKGRTAHAGGDPHSGRSALDAVELTNVGIQYLREHVTSDVRMHYIITDGGLAPNIVPDKASAWYFVRAETRERIESVYERLLNIARGAALMTETEMSVEFLGGCYPTLNNKVLVDAVHAALTEAPQDEWSAEDIAFAKEIATLAGPQLAETQKRMELGSDDYIYKGVRPIQTDVGHGSTDVGDIGHLMPTVMFSTACSALGSPGHSWQISACAGGSIGEKGMIYAARVMALFGLKALTDPAILADAKAEFDKTMAEKPPYVCPIPDDVLPPVY